MQPKWWYGLGGLLISAGLQAEALDQPLPLQNLSPLVLVHGLPAVRDGSVLASAQTEWRLVADVANHFVDEANAREHILLDGETRRLELSGRIGIGDGWELNATLPYIDQSGGNFDSLIEGWHKFWGLPDGGRPDVARNRLLYRYQRDNGVALDFQQPQSGIGDLQLGAAYRLWQTANSDAALAATVKLPTGDAERLTGDNATATDITLAISTRDLWHTGLTAFANGGMLWHEQSDVLPEIEEQSIWHLAIGLGWRAYNWLELKTQIEAHRAFYRSDLRALGSDPVLLTIGGSAQLNPNWILDVGFGEDLRVDTAPDATLQLALRWSH